jgi:hypothetical protein
MFLWAIFALLAASSKLGSFFEPKEDFGDVSALAMAFIPSFTWEYVKKASIRKVSVSRFLMVQELGDARVLGDFIISIGASDSLLDFKVMAQGQFL